MKVHLHPDKALWPQILARPAFETAGLEAAVGEILRAVRRDGDAAVKAYTRRFDQADLDVLRVPGEEIDAAEGQLGDDLKAGKGRRPESRLPVRRPPDGHRPCIQGRRRSGHRRHGLRHGERAGRL